MEIDQETGSAAAETADRWFGPSALDTNTCSWWDGIMANACSLFPFGGGNDGAHFGHTGRAVLAPSLRRSPASRGRERRERRERAEQLASRSPRGTSVSFRPRSASGGFGRGSLRRDTPAAGSSSDGANHRERVQLVGCSGRAPSRTRATQRRARLLLGTAAALIVVALALPWSGAGGRPLATPGPARVGDPVVAHSVYIVQPGDTLWTIAQRLCPGGDPRPVEAQLEAEVGGDTIVPGERLVLP